MDNIMVRNKRPERPQLTNLSGFPKKDTGSITLIKSDNSLFLFECYDYRGIFIGYMGNINPENRNENQK